MGDKKIFLDNVYVLTDANRTREYYRQWAKTYDDEVRANGYASPQRIAKAMADHVADKTAPLLDLGCGTGLSGEAFAAAGFTTIDGSDFSPEMLAAAKTKNIYRKLVPGDFNEPIPAKPGEYANIAAVGVFSPAHAPAEMIDTVVELLPRGGCFAFTLNDHALAEEAYERQVEALLKSGRIKIVFNEYGDHLPARSIQSRIYLLRKV